MTVTAWSSSVNTDFFGYKDKAKDNVVTTTFISGRTASYLRNTKSLKEFSCSLALKVQNGELSAFWDWYNNTLGGTAGFFSCSALGSGTYRFKDIPDPQTTSRSTQILQMNIEEV